MLVSIDKAVYVKVHDWYSFLVLLFSKFINMMMKHGNRVLAREIVTQVNRN